MLAMYARRMLLAIALTPLLMASAACGPKRLVATKPPSDLLRCSAEPLAPELPAPGIERDRIVLAYVLAMRAAYGDCAGKIAGIKAWSDALPE